MNYLFTSEAVTEGHPDKICDQLSDTILDSIIEQDPKARVACECCITTGLVLVMGEISTNASIDVSGIVRKTIREIGYDDVSTGFDANTCAVLVSLDKQSTDIALGVDKSYESKKTNTCKASGAGDQGMMFGYATNETKEFMPLPIVLANKLAKRLTDVRKNGILPELKPDGKTQVTVEYDDSGKAIRIDTVVISAQHSDNVSQIDLYKTIKRYVINEIIPEELMDNNTKIYINPTGRFVIGGPHGDSGLTGRKIIADTYGGMSRHGGGAFSGKDCTKVDRTAAYAARYVAKNIVAAGLADKCEIQLSYAIGVAKPISIGIETFNTEKIATENILKLVKENFDLTPDGIINLFNLRRPIYRQVSVYGHFGRDDLDLPWEKIDKTEILKKYVR